MRSEFSRTQLLYGKAAMERFAACRVAVFGLGGVGGYVAEALARSGIGALDLIDFDRIDPTNINRQILATHKTIGQYKVDVAAQRIHDINPDCRVRTCKLFYLPETQDQINMGDYNYVVDAIDTVAGKLAIIENAKKAKVPVISSMGAGNKTNPALFKVADLFQTSICPLARVMRRECKSRGITSLKVVYSEEKPLRPLADQICKRPSDSFTPQSGQKESGRRETPGSTAFVPSVAGLIIAGEIVNELARPFTDKTPEP